MIYFLIYLFTCLIWFLIFLKCRNEKVFEAGTYILTFLAIIWPIAWLIYFLEGKSKEKK